MSEPPNPRAPLLTYDLSPQFAPHIDALEAHGVATMADLAPLCKAGAQAVRDLDGLGLDKVTAFRLIALVKKTTLPTAGPLPDAIAPPPAPRTGNNANPILAVTDAMDHRTLHFLRDNRLAAFTDKFQELGVSTMGDLEQLCTSSTALGDLERIGLKRLQARTLCGEVAKAVHIEVTSPAHKAKPAAAAGTSGRVGKSPTPHMPDAEEELSVIDAEMVAEEARRAAAAADAAAEAEAASARAAAMACWGRDAGPEGPGAPPPPPPPPPPGAVVLDRPDR